MDTNAIIFEKPGELGLRRVSLRRPGAADLVVDSILSGISTGTEKLLFEGAMPHFPGLSYPLVPGYETLGLVVEAGPLSGHGEGDLVFVPGSTGFTDAAGLFGANAAKLVVAGARCLAVGPAWQQDAPLLALAATAHNATRRARKAPDLIIGHGVLGRLLARIVIALGHEAPRVWETNPARRDGAIGYTVIDPAEDDGAPASSVVDASGDVRAIDTAIARLARQGELVLAGFYSQRVSFDFVPAFMREISLSIAAEFRPADMEAVLALLASGALSLDGLITHRSAPADAKDAFRTAFKDPECLKMVIDWRMAA